MVNKVVSPSDRIFVAVVYILSVLIVAVIGLPLLYVLSASISDPQAVASGNVYFFPVGFSTEGFALMFANKEILLGFKNSIIYTTLGTTISLTLTVLLAFPLSRKSLPGRNIITFFIAITMFLSGGLIPTYLLVDKLHMVNTIWAMVIPNAISTFNMILMRTYFINSIPEELAESAYLDGCNNFQYLLKIVLPLSTPVLAVIALYYGVAQWNSYFNALIYLRSTRLVSLQLVLRSILLANQISGGGDSSSLAERAMIGITVKYAVIVVSSLPMLLLYPFIQRYFVKGVMVGAIKG